MTSDYREEFFVAATLAQRAGEAIREIYYGRIIKEIKGDGTPVTNADKKANEIIVNGLMERFPADGMVSEEMIGEGGIETLANKERVWYVDPLDGTRGFTERSDQFAVHIGLAVQERPVLGIVYKPLTREGYTAIRGDGAYRHHSRGNGKIRLEINPASGQGLTIITDKDTLLADYCGTLRELLAPARIIMSGSEGLRIMKIAEGIGDLHFSGKPLRSSTWDLCAPQIIAEEAGAYVAYIDGTSITYQGQRELQNYFVVAGSKELGEKASEVLRKIF